MGKVLIIAGIILVIAGIVLTYRDRIPFLGKFPGDIMIERGNFKLYFPVITCIVLSILLSLMLYLINRWKIDRADVQHIATHRYSPNPSLVYLTIIYEFQGFRRSEAGTTIFFKPFCIIRPGVGGPEESR